MNFQSRIRLYPGRWVGLHGVRYDTDFIAWLKSVPMRTWDAQSKTWWFPENYVGVVLAEAKNRGLLEPEEIDSFYMSAKHHVGEGDDGLYRALSLTSDAPPELVEMTYKFWKRQFDRAGGMGDRLLEIESAYETIMGRRPYGG